MAQAARAAAQAPSIELGDFQLSVHRRQFPDAQDRFQAWLTSVGFLPVRPFTRMLRGRAELGDPQRTFAVAGPELG